MKQFAITLAAVIVGGFLAMLAYDRLVLSPRAAAVGHAQVAADARADLARTREQARQVATEVEASVQRSVQGARDAMDAQAKDADQRGLVVDAAGRATMFRVSLTEYYQANGRWPADADEAGLPAPTEMRGGAVREIRVGAQGVVTVLLDERFPGAEIVLRPTANAASGVVEWACEIKGEDALKRAMPRCRDGTTG